MKLVSWNMKGNYERWADIGNDVGIALVQEAIKPRDSISYQVTPALEGQWQTAGWLSSSPLWRRSTAIAAPSGRFELRPYTLQSFSASAEGALWVGRPGMLAVADVVRDDQIVLTVASVYGFWQKWRGGGGFADASVHAALSELSPLLVSREGHRLVVAGDLNILYGYGEGGSEQEYWKGRYQTVFDRAQALGLEYCGPWLPNGRQADPWPEELPQDSRCLPTFYPRGRTPATATRQLDHVFVSRSISSRVTVRALNGVDEWGSSDHCRIEITMDV